MDGVIGAASDGPRIVEVVDIEHQRPVREYGRVQTGGGQPGAETHAGDLAVVA